MILTGILRHYLTTLLQTVPKTPALPKLREQRQLQHARNLVVQSAQISKAAFNRRKEWLADAVKDGKLIAGGPEGRGGGKPNPLSDPAMMEGMMGMMKGQVAMMVPQSLIMGWINAFFSGYVISESEARLLLDILMLTDYSETAFPTHTPLQGHAASWCRYP